MSPRIFVVVLRLTYSFRDTETPQKPSNKAKDHENEGFLKSTWHKLTHQHENLKTEEDQKSKAQESKDDDEPKKASGSG